MKRMIQTFTLFAVFLLYGCNPAEFIANMTPSSSNGIFSYDEDIAVSLSDQTTSVQINWSVDGDRDDDSFWVARTENFYLNDYTVISGKLPKGTRIFNDSSAVHGNTYVYRVLRYYTTKQTTTDPNTGQTSTSTVSHHVMSGAVTISY